MAIRTQAEFTALYLTTSGQWPNNTTGEITPADLRAGILDTWDSWTDADNTLSGRIATDIDNLATLSGIVSSGLFTNVTATNTVSGLYLVENGVRVAQGLSTGLVCGGVVTQDGTSGVVIASGCGLIINHTTNPESPSVTVVRWNQISGVVISDLTAKFTQIAITSSGTVYQKAGTEFTSAERKTLIPLATALTPNLAINGIQSHVNLTWDVAGYSTDLIHAIGPLNLEGNVFSHQGSGLSINKSAGETFNLGVNYYNTNTSPNVTTDPALTGVTFQYKYRAAGGGYTTTANRTTIVPGSYDDGDGTLGSVGNSEWSVQRVYYAPITNKIFIHYGQAKYATLAAAQAGIYSEAFTPDPVLAQYNTLRCYLLVRGNTTNLADTVNNLFVDVNKFGAAIGTNVSTTSLQQAYNNSATPEITTDATRDGFTVIEGSGVGGNLYEGKNAAGSTIFSVGASGLSKFGDIAGGNYTEFQENTGFMYRYGSGVAWDDMLAPANGINPPGAPTDATRDNTDGTLVFTNLSTSTIVAWFQMSHGYKVETDLYPHIHWMKTTSASGTVNWRMRTKAAALGGVFGDWSAYSSGVAQVPDANTSGQHAITRFSTINGSGLGISTMIGVYLERTTPDTYGAPVKLLGIDIHYQRDTDGSRQEYIK